MLNNKKLAIIVIVIVVIVIPSIFVIRFGPYYFDFMTPLGVGPINSAHDDFKLRIILDSQLLDLDVSEHPELLKTNPYIFYDENNWVHRVATGATLELLLQSIGMEFENNCLVVKSKFNDVFGDPLKQTEFCDDGQTKLRMYSSLHLTEFDIQSYIPNDDERLVLIYDDVNDSPIDFTKYHHKVMLENSDSLIDHQD